MTGNGSTRTHRRPLWGRNRVNYRPTPATATFDPIAGWTTDPLHAMWASDPQWSNPGDGGAVYAWTNRGSQESAGATIGADGLVLPGNTTVSGTNCAVISHATSQHPTGDMEVIVKATATDWTNPSAPHFLAMSGTYNPSERNWVLWINSSGYLVFENYSVTPLGRSYSTTAAIDATDGVVKYIKATFDQDNGAAASEVRFYKSDDGSSWTQIGAPATKANTAANQSKTQPCYIGNSAPGDSTYDFQGTIHRVIVKDGIDGTTVLDADFESADVGARKFTESSSNAATVQIVSKIDPVQATSSKQPSYDAVNAAYNDQSTVHFATDDVLAVDIADIAQTYHLVAICNTSGGTGEEYAVGTGTYARYGFGDSSGGAWLSGSGATVGGGTADALPHLFRYKASGASSNLLVDETSVFSGNGGAIAATVLSLGAGNNGFGSYANYLTGDIALVLLFNTDPTALPEWADFTTWAETTYGLVIAP